MVVASRPQGETLASPQVPGLGGHRAVRMVGRMVMCEWWGCWWPKGVECDGRAETMPVAVRW